MKHGGVKIDPSFLIWLLPYHQCWTEGRSSTAVAEDLRPTATATVAEVLGHIYGRRFYWKFS